MNPDKREAERQWQRESFGTERQTPPESGDRLNTVREGDNRIALFDGDAVDDGKGAWIESDQFVDVRESL